MKYYLWTIGCQMNVADSRRLDEELRRLGGEAVPKPEEAELIVLNSCVVRRSAEERVYGRLSSLKPLKRQRPEILIALMGCAVGEDSSSLRERFPYVDFFLRPGEIKPLLEVLKTRFPISHLPSPVLRSPCAYVPVIYGCDNFCTYCIVPYRRGRERSRPVSEILAEVQDLVKRGAREVTLLGQNVDSYGHDLPGRPDLADLLETVHEIEGLWRIRFLTSHPKDMSDKLIEAVARLPKVCEHIELPVQSGDDEILKRMGRGYTVEHYRLLVERLRRAIPGLGLVTDVIVGFPGETEEQFMNTYNLLREIRFDMVHVAAYSPRPGTAAARLPDDVPPEEKERRRRAIEELQERISGEINRRLVGETVEILVEEEHKGKWKGRTRTNKLVFFPASNQENFQGKLVKVRLTWAGPWSMQGELREQVLQASAL